MTALTVLCSTPPRRSGEVKPGGRFPYGAAELASAFDLDWVEPRGEGPFRRIESRIDGAVRRLSPGRRGWALARAAGRRAPGAVLSIFEDAGLAWARRRSGGAPRMPSPHVMIACWLAQDVCDRPSDARSLAASLRSVDTVCVYSANQVPILADRLGLPLDRIRVVPFGVDTAYYDPEIAGGLAGGGGVVAVGSDSRRDYATLFAAAERSGIPVTVACAARNLEGLHVPRGVRIVRAFDAEYRDLLHRADLVVTVTTAPQYPSGQSVVLEAMSMGRATLTTDSTAMRDYVDDGRTGLLTPAGDAGALAERMTAALRDDTVRAELGRRAARTVRERFSHGPQWRAVQAVIEEVSA